ncbi:hypothetical protein Sjap_007266 [Stephania japonica]|uniref:pectinesterase n=1 Tax=Stephania japonica TaxID=461633 RepID=A0AAP0PA95_9MAGN
MFLTISTALFSAIAKAEMSSEKGNTVDDQNVAPWEPTTSSISKQIIVSQQPGYGNYATIQAAIDQGVPENNAQWIHIFNMMDQSMRRDEDDNKERIQAVAACVKGDKIAFIQCYFVSVQDALFDFSGRHYFYKYHIQSYVDFIFAILGRAWEPYSRVIFFQSNFSDVIVPSGWDAWNYAGQEYNLEYAEMGCYGPGANTSQRVKWKKQLTQQQANDLLGNGFINSDEQNQMNIVRGLVQDQARQRAVAVHVGGDKIAFIQCSFMSVQDTLFDDVGRHYFYNCRIEGYVDFIFGSGQSVYEGCHIITYLGDSDYSGPGYITAQRRNSRNDPNGFVFKHCTVEGNPKVYLGRAWGPYSRVVFFQSNLSNVIAPAGWVAWDYTGQEYKFTYGEMNCYGPGANRSERVKWEKHLTQQQANDLLGNGFINTDGWLDQLPIKLPHP